MSNPNFVALVENTHKLENINPQDYKIVYLASVHGTMWDFADSQSLKKIIAKIYQSNGNSCGNLS